MTATVRHPAPGPVQVTLSLLVAEIHLLAGDRTDVTVTVGPRDPADHEDVRAADGTRVEHADGRLAIRAPRSWRRFSPVHTGGAITVVVELPTGSDVRGDASIADLRAEGTLGTCTFTTAAGDLAVDEVGTAVLQTTGRVDVGRASGPVEIRAAAAVGAGELAGAAEIENLNGATRVAVAAGALRCRAANGDIVIGTCLASVEATTANGDVVVDDIVRGTVDLRTGRGRIEIGVREGTAAHLDVLSQFGRVHNTLTAGDGPAGAAEIATVRARTSFGDVVVRRPDRSEQP